MRAIKYTSFLFFVKRFDGHTIIIFVYDILLKFKMFRSFNEYIEYVGVCCSVTLHLSMAEDLSVCGHAQTDAEITGKTFYEWDQSFSLAQMELQLTGSLNEIRS